MTVGSVGRSDILLAMSYAQRGAPAEGTPGEEAGESPAAQQAEAETPQAGAITAASSPGSSWSETHKVDLLA